MVPREFIFVIDRSGSMYGKPITLAKEALKLFIKSIPERSLFNVISFGSGYQTLFDRTKEYTNENVTQALQLISEFDADLGGTEILSPLNHIYSNMSDSSL